jgi:two-component system, OmpR family, phosphate regulon sensor histidine kinase PhoR
LWPVNKRITILIIIMISTALVGLMLIQGYWIRNSYHVNQANFIRTIHEAAYDVIIGLEKREMAREFERNLKYSQGAQEYNNAVDSVNRVLLQQMQSIRTRRDLEVFYNKFFLTRDLMEDLIIIPEQVPIEQKVSRGTLDSMITASFAGRELNTRIEYAIYSTSRDSLLYQTTGEYRKQLLDPQASFHFELYPDDMRTNPDLLMLYFPKERQYLIGRVWYMLLISITLIIVIILSFTYTFLMFNRQRKLSELKTDFINNMTHEFKTPVSTISLACEALNDKDIQKSEELYHNYIQIISEENQRLGLMAEQILQSAKLEKGDLVMKREVTDIHELLTEVIRNISIQVEIKDGRITKDFQAQKSIMEIDRMHMSNVFLNLLDNANKYTPNKPQISVTTSNHDHWLICSIEDNGIGISKSDQKKIFEKLYRVPEGNVHNFKGFGLGLSYVKTIVEKHGGQVRLESELKKGTRFDVMLPLNQKNKERHGK